MTTSLPDTRIETERPLASVRIVDIDLPFMSMVFFMVKWAFATIPALFIVGACGALIVGFVRAMGAP